MTKEEMKERFTVSFLNGLEDDIDNEEDRKIAIQALHEFIQEIGGWDKLYSDIGIGVKNGYSEEQQFQLLEKLIGRIA